MDKTMLTAPHWRSNTDNDLPVFFEPFIPARPLSIDPLVFSEPFPTENGVVLVDVPKAGKRKNDKRGN